MHLVQLKRIRWAVRAALMVGVAVSVTANVLHAQDNPISQSIAAWPPLALLLTIELISRIPVHTRRLAVARLAATTVIAGIAAWVSYWHMVGVASRYGETGASPYMIPISVDGLVVVASICLVELAGRISALQPQAQMTTVQPTRATFDYDRPIGPEPAPPVAEVDKLSTQKPPQRKPHASAADRVIAAHNRTPNATDERIAERINVSLRTVRRHRPRPSPRSADIEPEMASVPG